MNQHSIKAALVAAATAALAATVAFAADPASRPDANAPGKGDMHGMMGNSKSGGSMMDMMQSCQSMMGSGMHGDAAAFKLPAGNEKLEAQMHAEMLQKMGEIAGKYADRVKEGK